jgi:primosomal protein N' (replication factor Y)
MASLAEALAGGSFAPFLLHGVTGSGKTEIYLQAIADVLARGKTALVLVPEIALTPQLVGRFKRRFRQGIAVLHSGLSDGERYDEWRRIRRGEAEIVIGARSAIFAPLERIGIIVVDEEHESSYKQSEGFRYNARDLALVRGKMAKACVLLGSATPLVTTFHAARSGRLGYLHLPHRVRELPMPTTELLDARGQKGETFLPSLVAALTENVAQGGAITALSQPARVCHLPGLPGLRPCAPLPKLCRNAYLPSGSWPPPLPLLRLCHSRPVGLSHLSKSGNCAAGAGNGAG